MVGIIVCLVKDNRIIYCL